MNWQALTPQAKIELVRHALEQRGLSYSQAAVELGATRNAVAGVVNDTRNGPAPIVSRSGLRNVRDKPPAAKPRRTGDNFRAVYIRRRLAVPGDIPADARPPLDGAWQPLPGSSPVLLWEHKDGCRWPVTDQPLYCNEKVETGHYCPAHAAMATRPLPPPAVRRKTTSDRMTASVNMAWEQS